MFKENDLHWFPMRVRNSSVNRLETMLERLNKQDDICEAFAPLGFIRVRMDKMDFAPLLLNYVFVRSTFAKLVAVKSNMEYFEPLRFVMHPVYDANFDRHDEVLYLRDKQMDDYKRITSTDNEKIIFLDILVKYI